MGRGPVQISEEAVGEAPIDELSGGIELDWAFFEQKLGDRSTQSRSDDLLLIRRRRF